jgi:hypothetical protein
MIYCREKLVDVLLESPWISLEEQFDLDITLARCIKIGLFTQSDWNATDQFLATGNGYTSQVESVIKVLAVEMGYTDERFFQNQPEKVKAHYYAMDKGVRL